MSRPSDPRFEDVTVTVDTVIKETDKALLVEVDGSEVWIPKSQMRPGTEIETEGDKGALVIPRWLAEEKELED